MSQIHGIGSAVPAIPDIGSAGSAVSQPESGGFMDSLKAAIGKVNDAQLQGGQAVDALLTGQSQDIHRTMVALQQASVSFQLMMQVRNKLVTAYEEIQRMQI
ncbi:MAG: flagellar hook-basal body complex protein FliE [Nitrospira sp.]|nr:flagellar hook-basal body complex protein FliE [Nitrospira sp.]